MQNSSWSSSSSFVQCLASISSPGWHAWLQLLCGCVSSIPWDQCLLCVAKASGWFERPTWREPRVCRALRPGTKGKVGADMIWPIFLFISLTQPTLRSRCDFFLRFPSVKLISSLCNRASYKMVVVIVFFFFNTIYPSVPCGWYFY